MIKLKGKKRSKPYISIVVATRNDDYGGNLQNSFQHFLNNLNEYHILYPNLFDLVVIEYNPLPGKKSVQEIYDWKSLHYSIITASDQKTKSKGKFKEYHAKNIGIRNAKGRFILVTNPDIIFSPSLMKFLSKKKLKKSLFYCVDRLDYTLKDNFPLITKDEKKYMKTIVNLWTREGIKRDFLIPSKKHFSERYNSLGYYVLRFPFNFIKKIKLQTLHFHNQGDFLIAHNTIWRKVRGHYEHEGNQYHLDSLVTSQFIGAGITQALLVKPLMIYHRDHKMGYNMDEVEKDPHVKRVKKWIPHIALGKEKYILNGSNWGHSNNPLKIFSK